MKPEELNFVHKIGEVMDIYNVYDFMSVLSERVLRHTCKQFLIFFKSHMKLQLGV